MRKVVDSSALRHDILRDFFSTSPRHQVVLPEEVLVEATKNDSVINFRKSLEIMSQFPKQVLIAKRIQIILGLKPKNEGIQRRLIDPVLTRGFIKNVPYNLGCTGFDRQIVDAFIRSDGQKAAPRIDLAHYFARYLKRDLLGKVKGFSDEEIEAFQSKQILPVTLRRVHENALALCEGFKPKGGLHPQHWREATASLQYRYAMAMEATAVDWAVLGGLECRSEPKIANDVFDLTPIAFGTYFDGILSRDGRMNRVFEWTKRIAAELLADG